MLKFNSRLKQINVYFFLLSVVKFDINLQGLNFIKLNKIPPKSGKLCDQKARDSRNKAAKGAKMDRNFNKARTQGILGAVCILCASASFLASDQSLFWIVRTLAWLFALTFFHYALIRAQELSNSNVFTIFKYAYNGFLAMILCTVALYVFDKNFLSLISDVIIPLAVFAVSIAWVVINLKLAKASGCALFSIYAWMLAASLGANFIYGMLEVLSPALIAPIVKFEPLINALFDLATSGVLFAAWISVENFSNEQDEIEINLTKRSTDNQNLSMQILNGQNAGLRNLNSQNADNQNANERKFDELGTNETVSMQQNSDAQDISERAESRQNLSPNNYANDQILNEQDINTNDATLQNLSETVIGGLNSNLSRSANEQNLNRRNLDEQSANERVAELKFDAPKSEINEENLAKRRNMQENLYRQETLRAAKKQGIISCWFLLAIFAVGFLIKVYTAFTQPHTEAEERFISLAGDLINVAFSLISAIYMWFALKKLEEIYDTRAFAIYKRTIIACIVFVAVAVAYILIRGAEDQPVTAGAGLAGLFMLAIVIYLIVLWFKLNFELASVTQNKLFKTYVFFTIIDLVVVLTLQIMLFTGYFTTLFSIMAVALSIAILYVLPTAFYLYAWTRIEEYLGA